MDTRYDNKDGDFLNYDLLFSVSRLVETPCILINAQIDEMSGFQIVCRTGIASKAIYICGHNIL
jgi:hypothetical protein